jgi:hypothetical protein
MIIKKRKKRVKKPYWVVMGGGQSSHFPISTQGKLTYSFKTLPAGKQSCEMFEWGAYLCSYTYIVWVYTLYYAVSLA